MTGSCFKNPSHFSFTDNETSEWSGYNIFTFFTQYDKVTPSRGYCEALFFCTNCFLSCLLNSLVVFTIARSRELRSVFNLFLVNLAVADLVFGLSGPVLAWVRLEGDWNLGDTMCHFTFCLMMVCCCVVCWTIAAVSMDRYIHIVHPMNIRLTISARQAVFLLVAIWMLAIAVMSPFGVFFQVVELPLPYASRTAHVCTLLWPSEIFLSASIAGLATFTLAVFLLPAVLMSWCHVRCVSQIRLVRRTLTDRMDSTGSNSSVVDMKRRRALRDYRVVRTFTILFVLYLLAWGPLFCVLPLIVQDTFGGTNVMTSSALVWTIGLAQVNAVVNPVVYGISMRTVRTSLWRRVETLCYKTHL